MISIFVGIGFEPILKVIIQKARDLWDYDHIEEVKGELSHLVNELTM